MDRPDPPPLDIPPEMGLDAAATAERFLIRGEHANLWFEGRGEALVISFDNLATIDEGWPRGPWLHRRLEAALRPLLLRALHSSRPTGSLHCEPAAATLPA